ncbi:MBL fold metallo-hydrolase [Salinibacterium sp. ZJ454]|uniref:MBL fold metallo-hydrolase n=1 Tax=Salinibacterium sp. ZJ454 TaxID=2708339 RepID=UPI001421AA4D|nr:MBL fold metallo-hydrolase [Salinibacterium sp. ZJ454]
MSLATTIELYPGVWQLRIPFTTSRLGYVFSYLIEDSTGDVHLIDPGPAHPDAWAALTGGFESVGHRIDEVRSVLLTHLHHDHAGAATRVRSVSGAVVLLHERDAVDLHRFRPYSQCLERMDGWGVPEDAQGDIRRSVDQAFASTLVRGAADGVIADGEILDIPGRRIEAVWTPGHTRGHLVFADAGQGALFTGDHLLPRITPGIGLGMLGDENPIEEYLWSLARMSRFESFRAHPGHEHSFSGISHRCLQLRDRHERRGEGLRVLAEESPGASLWDLTRALPWSHGWDSVSGHHQLSALVQTEAQRARLIDHRGE